MNTLREMSLAEARMFVETINAGSIYSKTEPYMSSLLWIHFEDPDAVREYIGQASAEDDITNPWLITATEEGWRTVYDVFNVYPWDELPEYTACGADVFFHRVDSLLQEKGHATSE